MIAEAERMRRSWPEPGAAGAFQDGLPAPMGHARYPAHLRAQPSTSSMSYPPHPPTTTSPRSYRGGRAREPARYGARHGGEGGTCRVGPGTNLAGTRRGYAGSSGDASRLPGSRGPARGGGRDADPWHRRLPLARRDRLGSRRGRRQGVRLPQVHGRHRLPRQTFAFNRAHAKANGLSVGAYHFARPDPAAGDAVREARWFVDQTNPRPGELLPVLDIETSDGLTQTRDDDVGPSVGRGGARAHRRDTDGLHEPLRVAGALRRHPADRTGRLAAVGRPLGGERRRWCPRATGMATAGCSGSTRARATSPVSPVTSTWIELGRDARPAHDPQADPRRGGRRRGRHECIRRGLGCAAPARRTSTPTPPSS